MNGTARTHSLIKFTLKGSWKYVFIWQGLKWGSWQDEEGDRWERYRSIKPECCCNDIQTHSLKLVYDSQTTQLQDLMLSTRGKTHKSKLNSLWKVESSKKKSVAPHLHNGWSDRFALLPDGCYITHKPLHLSSGFWHFLWRGVHCTPETMASYSHLNVFINMYTI